MPSPHRFFKNSSSLFFIIAYIGICICIYKFYVSTVEGLYSIGKKRPRFFSVVLFFCLSGCLSVCLSVCLSACLSLRPSSACVSACLSICLPVRLSVCLCVCLSFYLSVRLSVCLSNCPSVHLFVSALCLSICLSLIYNSPLWSIPAWPLVLLVLEQLSPILSA